MSTRFFYSGKELQGTDRLSTIGENKTIIIMTDDGVKIWANTKGHVKNILSEYANKFLQSNGYSALLWNWSRSGFYCDRAKISPKIQTYHITKAIALLKKYSGNFSLTIDEMIELASFVESLASKTANTFTFGTDTDSLNFLFDDSKKPSKKNLVTDMNKNAIDNLFELTTNAFYELGIKFKKVQINSGYRTAYDQAGIMLKPSTNLSHYKTTEYFIKYLQFVKAGDEATYTAYYEENKGTNKGDFDNRIGNKNGQLITDVQTRGIQTVLGDYIENKDYQPSPHPYHRAYDIDKNISTDYMYKQHKGGKSDKYTTHYHISVS